MMEKNFVPAANETVTDFFGSNLFDISVMRERLPMNVFQKLSKTIEEGRALDAATADIVANAMKDWAVEKGATHFCHWFQPLTGLTAEKHTSFLSPTKGNDVTIEFSGKDLIRGEPDASSFPSGSLRESFEARGYTVWDYTSPAFIKEDGDNITMFIPSAFCSYTGDALDYKTPLLRTNEAINREALRVLRALGDEKTKRVFATVGAEQEYFLIEKRFVENRLDIKETGRTLFGARPPKNMALSVHYFGAIGEQVASFMAELNNELWKLGILAKTQHHEISPSQFEIAPEFSTVNVATDQNQLIMQTLQKVAARHDLECLIHDKPFSTLGGSGKHINWSLATDRGVNLLDPGKTIHENIVFFLFLCAFIKAVDTYPELIRESVATPGNDLRMGAMEAPPAIMSIFLGDQLHSIIEQFAENGTAEAHKRGEIRLGVKTISPLPKDLSDRNRTSPIAFTGNRFEFRTPGSGLTISRPVFSLNVAVADVLSEIADELEQSPDPETAVRDILSGIVKNNGRILYSSDNYSDEWVEEAQKRGLVNLNDTIDALSAIEDDKTMALFERQEVLTRGEYEARMDSAYDQYAETILIEARTALAIAKRQILPTAITYSRTLADAVSAVNRAGGKAEAHKKELDVVCSLIDRLYAAIGSLESSIVTTEQKNGPKQRAITSRDLLIPGMDRIREAADSLEMIVDAELWPLPTYAEMVYGR
jgi:glutamine synthetase